ncbi:chemotaxis protein CheW [Agarivorans sp. OAG1]|uniref:Chemotaxis protein CheV n=2 Tax=Agarivorans TaxID=261825 RepID=R9PMY7_AGAAL|nr:MULTISPECIES: chemotaxis protein CheV [Agarivorans]BEU02797.1 chemotaxis protein CheW [Agarivorans sp. OAG1]MEE1672871.1 chemotaxis protein CheV [Agarivorans aestuarii]MPW28694.1 response regulator [Agarivorans sp. B2Z047]UQN41255.1 chemotaxis protein CheV [Agarivorans sp. B2Z047]GAD02714.1 chemotaxis protein CheV [Agarivorans albus MKT 106]
MAGILDSVNQRTQLVGQNRLELLLFRLNGSQRYGINVFKVKEVLQCPPLTALPKLNPVIRGVAHIRGQTISVIDLSSATGGRPIEDVTKCFIIISEYNRSVQGFLVGSVERIVNMNWEDILPPPKGAGKFNYLTAVTEVEKELVSILDVEKILDEISPVDTTVSKEIVEEAAANVQIDKKVLVVDDSSVARNQVKRAVTSLGVEALLCQDGREALELLTTMAKDGPITDQIALVISDIEMPEMDGYTLTAEVRSHPDLKGLHIILHTSLSGVFNQAMVNKVGANAFIAKFNPDELAAAVRQSL